MRKKLLGCIVAVMALGSVLTGCGEKAPESNAGTPTVTVAPTVVPTKVPGLKYSVDESVKAAALTDTLGVNITDEMRASSIVCPGNTERLAKAMEKAAKGEEVTIAYLGGSITFGSLAQPQDTKCYAALSTDWWRETFPNAKINYVNAGVGATDSYLGVHRVEKDVLSKNPDLVIVEYSVNDTKGINEETYESLLRKILGYKSEPAVISLVLCTENFYYKEHYQIAYSLNVPCISYAKVVQDGVKAGAFAWLDVGAADKTHPITEGHAVIANLLSNFFTKTFNEVNETEYTKYELPEKPSTLNRYENANILFGDEIEPVSMDGFEKAKVKSNLFNNNGFKTTTGGTITFKVKASNLGIVFWGTKDGKSGQFDVFVNDNLEATIDADFKNRWGSYADYIEIGKFSSEQELTVTIKPKDGSTGDNLSIIALTVS